MWARVVWVLAVVLTVAFSEDCSTPSAPTPTAPAQAAAPPPIAPPALSCPSPISITAPFTGPALVTYSPPSADGGAQPVSVSCTPEAGATFPIATTTVECTATDAQQRTATCSFPVTVEAAPRLRLTKILAFGDSITAGDVIVPGTDNVLLSPTPRNYPAVLGDLVRERYGNQPRVVNAGLSGEHAFGSNTLPRFTYLSRLNESDVAVILEGFNDILYADAPKGIADMEIGVSVLAADARRRGLRTFIALLTPTRAGRRQIPLAIVQQANDRLRVVARGEGAGVIDTFTPLLADLNAYVGTDGLHLTEAGYRKLGETVFAAIRADLEIK